MVGTAEQIFQLEARLSELTAENQALRDRIAHLEAQLNANSDNSSKPPSADPVKPRQSRAERRAAARAAGRRQGKQPGAPGANLARRTPDETLIHVPVCCGGCGADLADAPVVATACRQVLEIPEIRLKVTDHVVERRRCGCGQGDRRAVPPRGPSTGVLGTRGASLGRISHGPPAPAP